MQDSGNQNAVGILSEEDDVTTPFHAPQAAPDLAALSAKTGITGKHHATRLQIVEIADCLLRAPCAERIIRNAQQIVLRAA